jgi:hypothetical protein
MYKSKFKNKIIIIIREQLQSIHRIQQILTTKQILIKNELYIDDFFIFTKSSKIKLFLLNFLYN